MLIAGLGLTFIALMLVFDVVAFLKMTYPRPRIAFYPGGALVAIAMRAFSNKSTCEHCGGTDLQPNECKSNWHSRN